MSRYDYFFKLAKDNGIDESELSIDEVKTLLISLFHGEIDNYSDNTDLSIVARGKVGNKCGAAKCDCWNKDKAQFLVNEITKNAKVIESEDPIIFYKGSKKYKKINTYNKELEKISIDEKIAKMRELERLIKENDKRVIEVSGVDYQEISGRRILWNSHGLKLSTKSNLYAYFASCVVCENNQTKTEGQFFIENDFSKFDPKKLADIITNKALAQLGGSPCESKKYKAILSQRVVRSLLGVIVDHTIAEEVQKNSSVFKDKLETKVLSRKITIEDRPLDKTLFACGFDDEGVATYNKFIVKNGILKTYLYNLTTATKENRESTGNAAGGGGKMGTSPTFLRLKAGKKSFQDLLNKIQNGVYITNVEGLHSGLNPQSGDFSLQAKGFLVENGKVGKPLDLITVSGNVFEVFNRVVDIANDSEISLGGISAPSMAISKLSVSGK